MQRKKKQEEIRFTSDDLLLRPGTYFNPVNQMVVVVDDSDYIDMSNVDLSDYDGDEWLEIADEPLIDSAKVEEMLQLFQTGGGIQSYKDISETGKDQQSKTA